MKPPSFLKFTPKMELKADYRNFLGIPLESMFEHRGNYDCTLDTDGLLSRLKRVETAYRLEKDDKQEEMDLLMDEIKVARKYLDSNYGEQTMDRYYQDFIEDLAQLNLLKECIKEQPRDVEYVYSEKELKKYTSKNKQELLLTMGSAVGDSSRNAYFQTHTMYLPNNTGRTIRMGEKPIETLDEKKKEDYRFGKRLFNALKDTLGAALCDPKNRTGKELISKDSIRKVIIEALARIGIVMGELVLSAVALVLLYTLDVFCKMVLSPKKS